MGLSEPILSVLRKLFPETQLNSSESFILCVGAVPRLELKSVLEEVKRDMPSSNDAMTPSVP
jgi:hypothetical protein